jgi:phage-related protein
LDRVLYLWYVADAKTSKAPKPSKQSSQEHHRQWRDYRTEAGGRPIKDFIDALTDEEAASVAAAMREVREEGVAAAKHLRGEIYEARADTKDKWIRLLFATQGRFSQVLLSLSAFEKKTNKTPPQQLQLAEDRLESWKARGRKRKAAAPAKKH